MDLVKNFMLEHYLTNGHVHTHGFFFKQLENIYNQELQSSTSINHGTPMFTEFNFPYLKLSEETTRWLQPKRLLSWGNRIYVLERKSKGKREAGKNET